MSILVGIDEVGRGPLAGPVAIGIVAIPKDIDSVFNIFGELKKCGGRVKDSKKLSEKRREEVYKKILQLKKEKLVDFGVFGFSSKIIDKIGITGAIANLISQGLKKLKIPVNSRVLLDGLLKAPKEYLKQKTIIKGDEKELVIALASIVAKVWRDKKMTALAKNYPQYGLEIHKGYGTKKHREMIKRIGISTIHRKTFCTGVVDRPNN